MTVHLTGARVAVVAADAALRDRLQELVGRLGHQVTCTEFRPDGALDLSRPPEVLLWAPWSEDAGAAVSPAPLDPIGLARVAVVALCPGGDQQRHEALQAGADVTLTRVDAAALEDALAGVRKFVLLRREMEADGAPGVLQPASFQRALDEEFQRLERYPGVLSLLRVQVDPGPGKGLPGLDLQIGAALRRGLRDVDRAAHLEEHSFALLLPLTDAGAARKAANRIHRLARALVLRPPAAPGRRAPGGLIKCTVSVGVATFPSPGVQGKNQLLQRAQQAAALATEGGGDRVVYHDGEQFLTAQEQGGSGA